MACNLLGSGDGCGISIIWVIILLWLLFFNSGNCSCGGSSSNCGCC